jgi:YopX protein
MREIKFRAWLPEEKHFIFSEPNLLGTFFLAAEQIGQARHSSLVIQQFSGLKDRNGNDVYEGDTVAVFDGEEQTGIHEVEYCGERNYPAFDFKGWDGETNGLSEAKEVFALEVIGNIYEKLELLATN